VVAMVTLFLCAALNRYNDREIGGIPWPYISDLAREPPESAIFGFGMTITAALIAITSVLNYGRVKREIEKRQFISVLGMAGWKRNRLALALGLTSSPFLGLLAVFDTVRSPQMHLLFVLLFFPTMVAYVFVNNSIYNIIYEHYKSTTHSPDSLTQIKKSIRFKQIISNLLLLFVILYLPVGMSLVSDWYNYRNDIVVHTFRAVCQHLCVVCLLFYFGTFWFDFGDLVMTVIQYED